MNYETIKLNSGFRLVNWVGPKENKVKYSKPVRIDGVLRSTIVKG